MVAAFKQPHVTHPHAIDVPCVEHIFKTTCEISHNSSSCQRGHGKDKFQAIWQAGTMK